MSFNKFLSKLNLIYFQIAWYWTAVLAQNNQSIYTIPLFVIGWAITIWAAKPSMKDIVASLLLCIMGFIFDFTLHKLGVINFPNSDTYTVFGIPFWLCAIWILFSSVLNSYVEMFKTSRFTGAAIMAVFAPLSYLVAYQMKLISFEIATGIIIYAAFWFIFYLISHKVLNLNKY